MEWNQRQRTQSGRPLSLIAGLARIGGDVLQQTGKTSEAVRVDRSTVCPV